MPIESVEKKGRVAEILLVEDNPGDALLTRKAFKGGRIPTNITVAPDADVAMAVLLKQGEYSAAPTPDIILLDLNLPKKDGKEILKDIKANDALKHIPVVILTSSRAELDVVKSYHLYASGYIIKPVSLDKFTDVVTSIENFWFTQVLLPDDSEAASGR